MTLTNFFCFNGVGWVTSAGLDGSISTTKIDVIILSVAGEALCSDAGQHNVAEVSNKTQSNCNSFHRDW